MSNTVNISFLNPLLIYKNKLITNNTIIPITMAKM